MTVRSGIASRGLFAILVGLTVSCAAPPSAPPTPAAEVQVTQAFAVARRAYERGDFPQAQDLYLQALLRARAIDHAALAADAAYNLAVSEIALQDYTAADRHLQEAGHDAVRASTDTTEPLLLRAKVAYLRGRLPDAVALAQQLLESPAAPALRRQALLLRGQIHAESGDLAAAREDLSSAIQSEASEVATLTSATAADAKKLEGTIELRAGNSLGAAQRFDAEADLLRQSLRYRDMAHAHARAADAYLAAGQSALAAQRFFLAGRSLDGLGDAGSSRALLESSLSAAMQAGDVHTLARARALLDEISRRAVP